MLSSSNQAIYEPVYILLCDHHKYFNNIFHYLFVCWILYGGKWLLNG